MGGPDGQHHHHHHHHHHHQHPNDYVPSPPATSPPVAGGDAVMSPRASTSSYSDSELSGTSPQSTTSTLSEFDSAERSPPYGPSTLAAAVRQSHDTPVRQRQISSPSPSTPDPNAQSVLRQRIIEIQALNLPERDKAKRIQVCPQPFKPSLTCQGSYDRRLSPAPSVWLAV
jgi:hypothetical protein